VVVEVQKPSSLQTAAVDYLSRKEEPHPLSSPKNINEETLDEAMKYTYTVVDPEGKVAGMATDEKDAKDIASRHKGKVVKLKKPIAQKVGDMMINRKLKENVKLDEMLDYAIIDGDNKIIGLYKGSNAKKQAQMNMKGAEKQTQIKKPIKIVPVSNKKKGDTVIGIGEGVDLDEREKSVRQLINPTKEVMIVKKNKVIVIDKKDQDKYMKQGWTLAEEVALEEARWKVKIEGLPPIYMDSKSAGEVRSQLRKLIKTPDMIQDIERVTDAEVKKALRNKISGKEVEEKLDKDDKDSVGDVVKQLKKSVKAHQKQANSLTKDMQDELQVKEWFKAKNIDVKVRELDESTQVYVPLGRRIPNEIREELITTQYGKMPEDVKNVKDINYGNFMENSITMNNDFWSKVLHGTKGE
jgi:hypothetical protein